MFTPGPWEVVVKKALEVMIMGENEGERVFVAKMALSARTLADARLIAAAPRLLEAAQSMLKELMQDDSYSHFNGRVMELRAAIAAATGEGEPQ